MLSKNIILLILLITTSCNSKIKEDQLFNETFSSLPQSNIYTDSRREHLLGIEEAEEFENQILAMPFDADFDPSHEEILDAINNVDKQQLQKVL